MTALYAPFQILIFPGLIFLSALALAMQFMDRKLHARLQNRQGPPWFQPAADLIKLLGKERIMPEQAQNTFFQYMPPIALAAVCTAILYIPMWSTKAAYAFPGDILVTLYLMTIPTITFFLAGWYSASSYAMVGAVRTITQLFAYEIPLLLSMLGPAILAGSWSTSGIAIFFSEHPGLWLANLVGFIIGLISMLGKLEKVPFDIPEAETEIVAGPFTEYTGGLLAFFKLTLDVEMVVGSSLLAAVFLPFGLGLPFWPGLLLYLVKVAFIVALMCLARTIFARMRIDQMIQFCWKFVAPVAFAQVLVDLLLKGFLLS